MIWLRLTGGIGIGLISLARDGILMDITGGLFVVQLHPHV